jgi:hypothetical protein
MAWFAKKDGRQHYCTVSGGYVMYGSWADGEPRTTMTNGYCNMETFLAGQFNDEIRKVGISDLWREKICPGWSVLPSPTIADGS